MYVGSPAHTHTHIERVTDRSSIIGWTHQRGELLSRLEFQVEESHWCLLDLSSLHIHEEMEKMDMTWCSICSSSILPFTPSLFLPPLSVCLFLPCPYPPGCTHRPAQQEVGLIDSRAPTVRFCQSLHVSILHQQAATQWKAHGQWCCSATQIWQLCYIW